MNRTKIILQEKYFRYTDALSDEAFGRVIMAVGDKFFEGKDTKDTLKSDAERMLYDLICAEVQNSSAE